MGPQSRSSKGHWRVMIAMRILLTGACGKLGMAVRKVGATDHQFVLMDVAEHVTAEGGVRASVTNVDAVRQAIQGCDAVSALRIVLRAWPSSRLIAL